MSLLGDWLGAKRMKDPVRGTAQVVGASMPPDHATWSNCTLTLVVQAPGVPATPIKHAAMARTDRWPYPGKTLPVTVDRADPEKLKIHWDEVPESGEVAWEQAQAMAAGMGGGTQNITIDATGGEVDPAQRAQLAALGVDVDALIQQARAVQQSMGGGDDDDLSDQLAKLAQLHQSGALSDAEFAAAKKKLLEGS